jgi:hypothetical protein
MKNIFIIIPEIPEIWKFSFFLILFALFFIHNTNKEDKRQEKFQRAYWTKKRLAEYERAKKESEERGIPY